VLLKLIGLVMPIKASANEEGLGMDISQHGEEAYGSGEGAILILPDHAPSQPAAFASSTISGGQS
jgi:Amt family ammonium transporter